VGKLIRNTTVQIDRMQGQWAHLVGGTSWAWGPYLTPVGPIVEPGPGEPQVETPKEEKQYSVNVPAVNVRSGPGIENPIVSKLYKNTRVCVTAIQGEWARLDSGSWVFAAYLSPVS
jgi:hypothetical protein